MAQTVPKYSAEGYQISMFYNVELDARQSGKVAEDFDVEVCDVSYKFSWCLLLSYLFYNLSARIRRGDVVKFHQMCDEGWSILAKHPEGVPAVIPRNMTVKRFNEILNFADVEGPLYM